MNNTGVPPEPHDHPAYRDGADFDAFSRWHRPRLEKWYRRRGLSPEDAADVAQEALAGLAQRWRHLTTDEHRRRSYFTITKHKHADFLRRQGRRIQPDVSLDDDEQPELVADEDKTNPDVMIGGREETPLWQAVDALPGPRRDAVLGRIVGHMSYGDLADASGRSEHALRQDVARALSWLRQALGAGSCVVAAWLTKARRGATLKTARAAWASGSATVLGVVPQAALLSLLVTSPLYVIPSGTALAQTARELPRAVIEHTPRPLRDGVAGLVVAPPPARARRLARARVRVLAPRLRPSLHVTVPPPPVAPPNVCVKQRCGTGDRITVSVLGQDVPLPAVDQVELCWAVPEWAEPHVTCSESADPP